MSQQPTFHITKEHFVGVINSLHAQFVKDKENTSLLGQIFNTEIPGYYDNSALINSIFSFLHEVFPKDEDGNCEIQHYCYCLDFGKLDGQYESPEEFYDRLVTEKYRGCGIIHQIENNTVYATQHFLAPEDAFLPSPDEIA